METVDQECRQRSKERGETRGLLSSVVGVVLEKVNSGFPRNCSLNVQAANDSPLSCIFTYLFPCGHLCCMCNWQGTMVIPAEIRAAEREMKE